MSDKIVIESPDGEFITHDFQDAKDHVGWLLENACDEFEEGDEITIRFEHLDTEDD